MVESLGFTATRYGMSAQQIARIRQLLRREMPEWVHHGDCIGGDEQIHAIAVSLGIKTCIHPPTNQRLVANCKADLYMEPAPYLVRNRGIVDQTCMTVGAPYTDHPSGGGTWYTIRYAARVSRLLDVYLPDGSQWIPSEG